MIKYNDWGQISEEEANKRIEALYAQIESDYEKNKDNPFLEQCKQLNNEIDVLFASENLDTIKMSANKVKETFTELVRNYNKICDIAD